MEKMMISEMMNEREQKDLIVQFQRQDEFYNLIYKVMDNLIRLQ
jgi:hypothetical protein